MNAQDVQKKVAAALSRKKPLTYAECNELVREVESAMTDIGDRFARTGPEGAEYLRALICGSVDEVRKVEEEHSATRILADQLKAQKSELVRLFAPARLRQAEEELPKLYKALDEKLDAAGESKRAFDEATNEVSEIVVAIMNERVAIRIEAKSEPTGGISPGSLQKLNALNGAFAMKGENRHGTDWAHYLGTAGNDSRRKAA